MMRSPPGKWIRKLVAGATIDEAARLALADRLSELPRLLSRAASGATDSPAHIRRVHRLRVATRRAGAALRMFRDVLETKRVDRWQRRLRRIRRAAGMVRDLDIAIAHLNALQARARGTEAQAVAACIAELRRRRERAFAGVHAAAEKYSSAKLERATTRLLDSVDAAGVAETTAAGFARRVLRREIDEVKVAAAADLSRDIDAVHELRIAIKRLRYAMELFGYCFDQGFRVRLGGELSRLQEQLGRLNDAAGVLTIVGEWAETAGPRAQPTGRKPRGRTDRSRAEAQIAAGGARLLARLTRTFEREHAAFLAAWRRFEPGPFVDRLESAIRANYTPAVIVEAKPVRASNSSSRSAAVLNGHVPANRLAAGRIRIAAIDVGTNSLRLIVAEVDDDGSYRVLDDEKEVTRLGRGLHASGRLDPQAIEHSVAAIARMKSIAAGYGVDRIRLIATAAAREASNTADFREAVRTATGLALEVIPAEQEGLLAYRSASRAFDLSSTVSAVADIGGGSTEVVLAIGANTAAARVRAAIEEAGGKDGRSAAQPDPLRPRTGMIERLYTIPLGAVRLTERFGGAEGASGEQYREMRRFVKRVIKQHIRRIPTVPQLLVGTGGTFTTLGAMARQRESGLAGGAMVTGVVQGHEVGRAEVRHWLDYLRKLPLKERTKVAGLSPDRADIIVAGLTIIDVLLERLEVNRARIHEGGIRDGLLLSMIGERAPGGEMVNATSDPMQGVRRLAKACAYEEPHSTHVARLSLRMFDQLRDQLPAWPVRQIDLDRARQVLEAAALLHDIGYLINYTAHHKHSFHLIVHAELAGWTSREVQLIANIARYHRAAAPSRKHAPYAMLDKPDRELVRALAGILRLADGLDRTHMQAIQDAVLDIRGGDVFLTVASEVEPGVDLWGASRKGGLFEEVFGLTPHLEWKRASALRPPAGGSGENTGSLDRRPSLRNGNSGELVAGNGDQTKRVL